MNHRGENPAGPTGERIERSQRTGHGVLGLDGSGTSSSGSASRLREQLRALTGAAAGGLGLAAQLAVGLVETARVLVVVVDRGGRVVYGNRVFEHHTGWTLEDIEGEDWLTACIPAPHHDSVRARFDAAIADVSASVAVSPLLCADGRQCIVEWSDQRLLGESGDVVGLLLIGHDVTDRTHAGDERARLDAALEARDADQPRDSEELAAALRSSRSVLEGTFQAAPLCLAYLDTSLHFVRVNARYAEADGRTPDFFVGKAHFDLYPNADNRRIFERVRDTGQQHIACAKAFVYEHAPDRGTSHWDWSLTPVRDGEGAVVGLVLALHDVTDRVQAISRAATHERLVVESERRLRAVINSTTALVALCETDGTLIEVNEAALRLVGMEHGSVIGRRIWEPQALGLTPDAGAFIRTAIAGACDGRVVGGDLEVMLAGGVPGVIDTSFSPLRGADGEVSAIVATAINVTERQAALRALKVRDAAIESSNVPIALGDLEGRLTYANPAYLRAWGLPGTEDVVGMPVWAHWTDPAKVRAAFERTFRDGSWEGRQVARLASGEERAMRVSAAVVRDVAGQPICVTAAFADVTEAEEAAARVRAQLAEKEVLLKEVHHRVKNNLQVVSSLLHLQAGHAKEPRLRALIRESEGRIRAMSLVHETLYQSEDVGIVDFAHYAQRLVTTLRGAYGVLGREVEIEIVVDVDPLEIDVAIPCGLITGELVSNAFKHAFQGRGKGAIRVELSAQGEQHQLVVSDDGRGMPAGGTEGGLGLRLVNTLAGQLGGDACIEGGASGTRAQVRFPRPEGHSATDVSVPR